MEKNDLVLTTDHNVNPAQFLVNKSQTSEENLEHFCSEVIEIQTKIRPDLEECPLEKGESLFIDGSSRVEAGIRKNGYAIVNGHTKELLEAGSLPTNWSAQTCELYALNQALKLLQGKIGNIYTDSRYAFGVVHTFGKIWRDRGMINSKGKELVHEELIKQVLMSLEQPKRIAVVHVNAHKKGNSFEIIGNRLADEEAKLASNEIVMNTLIPEVKTKIEVPIFNDKEKEQIRQAGGQEGKDGVWHLPDSRQVINSDC